jgi:hypothetical protein
MILTTEIAGDFIALAESDFNAKLRIRQMEQVDTMSLSDAENCNSSYRLS